VSLLFVANRPLYVRADVFHRLGALSGRDISHRRACYCAVVMVTALRVSVRHGSAFDALAPGLYLERLKVVAFSC
jgi:hypothetical protein